MARLVVLSEGFTGRTYELKVEKTTIGRIDDNAFPIPEPSVSSHHCEIVLRGNDVVVRDLDSTNGTFINGDKVSVSKITPGQILRLGNVELRLEAGGPASAKKQLDQTLVIPQGVKLGGESDTTTRPPETSTSVFKKKSNKSNKIFLVLVGIVVLAIAGLLIYALSRI